jgi:hypothetical protein
MKTTTALAIIFAALSLAPVARANPTKITNEDAFALFNSLNSIQPGLTPSNVGLAAQDIWQLKGIAEAFQSASNKAARDLAKFTPSKDVQPTPAQVAGLEATQANWDSYRKAEVQPTPDLQPLSLSDEEIKEAKVTPGILAPILHYLSPSKK